MTIKELARKIYPLLMIKIYDRNGYHLIEARKAGDIHFDDDSFYQVEIKDFTIYENFVDVLI